MKTSSRKILSTALLSLGAMALSGASACPSTPTVPSPAQDAKPVVTIGFVKQVGTNQAPADFHSTTQSGSLNLPTTDNDSTYQVTASGSDSAGPLKELQLTVSNGGTVIQTVTVTQTLDPSGTALNSLSILGKDADGGNGPDAIAFVVNNDALKSVTATATNFNGQSTSITAVFNITPGAPTINSFTVSPNDNDPHLGRINAGDSAMISWNANCGTATGGCTLTIKGNDGLNYSHPAFTTSFRNGIGGYATGSMKVTPVEDTRYTLTVTNDGLNPLSASSQLSISLYSPPSPSGQVYYCTVSCTSEVTPCFVMEVYSDNQDDACNTAAAQTGCDASAATPDEVNNGCD